MTDRLDGRTARRDRNRDVVLDATIELFSEGSPLPGAIEVAERSGVSLRSVYRYFEDGDQLVASAIERQQERSRHLYELEDLGVGPLADRIERIVAQRVRLHEELAPMFRAILALAPTHDLLLQRVATVRDLLLSQIEEMFATELLQVPLRADKEVVAVLDALLGFAGIEHLRTVRHLSASDTRRSLERVVSALLAASV